jgi:predicted RNase H-like nuclease (RuvC/YqgF family)
VKELLGQKTDINVWNMLQYMDQKMGIITRTKIAGEKGFTVSFRKTKDSPVDQSSEITENVTTEQPVTKEKEKKKKVRKERVSTPKVEREPEQFTVDFEELISETKSEIDSLGQQSDELDSRIESLKVEMTVLQSKISAKTRVYEQLVSVQIKFGKKGE